MTLFATRADRHPNTPDTVPERVVIHTTYGPVVNEVTEDLGSVKYFHQQLGQLIEQLESGNV